MNGGQSKQRRQFYRRRSLSLTHFTSAASSARRVLRQNVITRGIKILCVIGETTALYSQSQSERMSQFHLTYTTFGYL